MMNKAIYIGPAEVRKIGYFYQALKLVEIYASALHHYRLTSNQENFRQ